MPNTGYETADAAYRAATGQSGRRRTTPSGYTITTLPTTRTPSAATRGSADARAGQADQYYNRGYVDSSNPNATTGNAFVFDPDLGRFMTAESYQQLGYGGAPSYGTGGGSAGYSYSGGGGGGYGGPNPADYDKYAAAMMQLIGGMDNAAARNAAVDADVATARSAYANAAGAVSMNDPYAALLAMRAPTVRPEMNAFLQSQGVPTDGYGQAVDYANAQLGATAQNWRGLGQTLGANHLVAQQGVKDVMTLQGEQAVQALEAQRAAMAEAVRQQQIAAMMQLISAGLPYGRTPDMGALKGLLG